MDRFVRCAWGLRLNKGGLLPASQQPALASRHQLLRSCLESHLHTGATAARTHQGAGSSQQQGEQQQQPRERNHVVKFYRNNVFTVDDGPPRGLDDPANLDFINAVSSGECPRELDPGDSDAPVTVNLLRAEEDYVPPK